MRVLGFTGTHHGMSQHQMVLFKAFLKEFRPFEFHHGDCIGADAQAHDIVRTMMPRCRIIVHPCTHTGARAFRQGDEILEALPPLLRNRTIVDASDEMVATPQTPFEILRSGTWATVRYARKTSTKLTIL